MPIYEFRCNACGKTFEKLLLSSERDETQICEACGSDDTCKVLSSFSCGSGASGLGGGSLSSCAAPSGGFS